MIEFLLAALIGAVLRQLFGIYKAYHLQVPIVLDFKRVGIEILAAFGFGVFGFLALQSFGLTRFVQKTFMGIVVCGFAGPDLITVMAKNIGAKLDTSFPQASGTSRQQKALAFIKVNGSISNNEYKKLAQVSDATALRDLRQMAKIGVVKAKGKKSGVRYYL